MHKWSGERLQEDEKEREREKRVAKIRIAYYIYKETKEERLNRHNNGTESQ